jgi:plasmid stabilization system protein ParE
MKQIVLSKAAQQDRQEITAYTVENFGIDQARRLRNGMQSRTEIATK